MPLVRSRNLAAKSAAEHLAGVARDPHNEIWRDDHSNRRSIDQLLLFLNGNEVDSRRHSTRVHPGFRARNGMLLDDDLPRTRTESQ
jgi:hypothetical protein